MQDRLFPHEMEAKAIFREPARNGGDSLDQVRERRVREGRNEYISGWATGTVPPAHTHMSRSRKPWTTRCATMPEVMNKSFHSPDISLPARTSKTHTRQLDAITTLFRAPQIRKFTPARNSS